MIFHHLGLAVTHPDKAINFLRGLGYRVGDRLYDEHQNVYLIYCEHASMPDVELIYRAESPGPLDNILRNFSEVVYHICYTCSDLQSTLDKIRQENRLITVSAPNPAPLFNNLKVSFYKVAGYGLIEILEDKKQPFDKE